MALGTREEQLYRPIVRGTGGEQLGRLEAEEAIKAIMDDLAAREDEETELLWAFVGLLAGLAASFWLLYAFGKVQGLSGPGITSGLSALGGVVGGGMLAGLGLLLAHAALWPVCAFFLARRKNLVRQKEAWAEAASELRRLRLGLQDRSGAFDDLLRLTDLLNACLGGHGGKAVRS